MAGFLTNSGLAKLAVATPITPMTVKYMAFDAGQGTPTPNMTALFNEVYRAEIPNPVKDPDQQKNLTFSGFVPTTVGGWTIYGVGLFDSLNVLIAYLQLAEPVLKSDPSSALKMSWQQDFIIALANAGETDLIVTDSVEFRHDAITHRDLPNSHPISAITGLQGALDNQIVHNNLSGRNIADAHPISAITGLEDNLSNKDTAISNIQQDINNKDDQNVKLTGDQTIDGLKSFNGNIEVETISNNNATITLESDGVGISAGSGANFTGISVDATSKKVNVTGQLSGDGSGLDKATATKLGVIQLATQAEVTTGTEATKAITPKALRDASAGTNGVTGWQRLPSGLIEQWGTVSVALDEIKSITFPQEFTSAVHNIQVSPQHTSTDVIENTIVLNGTSSRTAFSVTNKWVGDLKGSPSTLTAYWRAIGL